MKILRINLSEQKVQEEIIDQNHQYYKYAGRALSSKIIANEIIPSTDPLAEENKLIFASGFLGGTTAPNSGRISIGCKSPLTKGVKESNVGGKGPAYLSRYDIRALIFEGTSPDWVILYITNNFIKLIAANEYIGKNNYELNEILLGKYHKNSALFSIGYAGEKQLKTASIASTDMEGFPSRHAGRGGVGAVMGSKKLKALLIEPPSQIDIHYRNPESFKKITKTWSQDLYKAKRIFSKFGTAIGIKGMDSAHGLPTQNFRRGAFQHVNQISGDALHEYIVRNNGKFGISCSPGCAIRCSNLVKNSSGKHITSSLEYETIALNGSNLQINSIEKLAIIDHICDDLGVDSIEIGNAMGVYMETGKIAWGDADGVINLLKNIGNDNHDSLIIANGAVEVGKSFNIQRVAQVKGQGISGYDPRSFKGMGVTFLTSPMGADHTAGACISGRKAYAEKEYGEVYDPKIKVELSRDLQIFTMLLDSMGLCYFVGPSWDTTCLLADLLNARYGWNLSAEELRKLGQSWLQIEKEYNEKCGLLSVSNLPDFMKNEPLEEIDRKWDISEAELDQYWKKMK